MIAELQKELGEEKKKNAQLVAEVCPHMPACKRAQPNSWVLLTMWLCLWYTTGRGEHQPLRVGAGLFG
jgi:hypothetical protein